MGRYGAECLFTSGLLVSAWFGGARQRGANESNFWPARKIPFRINWPEHGAHYRGKDAQQYHLTVLCTYDLGKFCTCKCSSQVNEDCFCHVESHLCCHWLCSLTQMWLFWNVIFFFMPSASLSFTVVREGKHCNSNHTSLKLLMESLL